MAIFGLALVATASPAVAMHYEYGAYHFVIRHVFFLCLAIGGMVFLSFWDERMIWRFSCAVFGLSILAVILTLLVGVEIKGGQRWLRLFGFSLQPSEFLKPSLLVMTAWLLAGAKEKEKFPGVPLSFGLFTLCIALLMSQPDFGMSVLLTLGFGAQLFLFGWPLRYFVGLGGAFVALAVLAYSSFDHIQSRVDRFLDPSSGDSYQVERSLESFANGGLMGTGPGQGTVKLQLPDAHSDFIFSVSGEEFGFFFTFLVIGLYALILGRGLRALSKRHSVFAMLSGGALLSMIALQSFIHMGSAMQILPAKGMTLPLVSYGGSSLMALGFTFGVILAVTRKTTDRITHHG